jgi:hypothetical protein
VPPEGMKMVRCNVAYASVLVSFGEGMSLPTIADYIIFQYIFKNSPLSVIYRCCYSWVLFCLRKTLSKTITDLEVTVSLF